MLYTLTFVLKLFENANKEWTIFIGVWSAQEGLRDSFSVSFIEHFTQSEEVSYFLSPSSIEKHVYPFVSHLILENISVIYSQALTPMLLHNPGGTRHFIAASFCCCMALLLRLSTYLGHELWVRARRTKHLFQYGTVLRSHCTPANVC